MQLSVLLAVLSALVSVEQSIPVQRPNVLLIITDDQGWGDIHLHGNPILDTPVLDRLATEGARFSRFYVSPVCSPTRASLLTGRYHLRCGVHGVTRGFETMYAEEVTLAELFKKAGYATGCFGKWHNGAHYPYDPVGQGFDEFLGFCAGHWTLYFDPRLKHNDHWIKAHGYIADVLTDAAIDFIRRHRDRPFFCYLPYNTPHTPFQVPDRYFLKYKARGLDDATACIYGMVENLDENIGRLLSELDRLGLRENTIVLFTTDNGPNTNRYNGNMRGRKGSVHEGGVRVPLFVRWPGKIKPGTVVEPIAAHIDILPTLAELCRLKIPDDVKIDGRSLAPLLLGQEVNWPDRMIFTHWSGAQVHPNRGAVRTQEWLAVVEGGKWQLYNMREDPAEKHNIAEKYPQVLARLRSAYEQWFAEVTARGFDPIPIPVGYPQRPVVELPAHEAFLYPGPRQGISYSGPAGWAHDWITNWTDPNAYAWWELEVVSAGQYEIVLGYACSADNVGSKLAVEIGKHRLIVTLDKAHPGTVVPAPNRVPAKESAERIWGTLPVGRVTLEKGRTQLRVVPLSIAHGKVGDLKFVRIRHIK